MDNLNTHTTACLLYTSGVVVEAELGTLAGIEDDVKVAAHEASYTPVSYTHLA